RVSASGVISTIAGTGSTTTSGDGGPATSAGIYQPRTLAFDGAGNLYLSSAGANRIRKINTSGIITTVAGSSDTTGFSGDGGPATSAMMYWPQGVFVDTAGQIFIGDRNNERVRKVNSSGIISTIAGTGTPSYSGDGGPATSAAFNHPTGVAVDPTTGDLIVA